MYLHVFLSCGHVCEREGVETGDAKNFQGASATPLVANRFCFMESVYYAAACYLLVKRKWTDEADNYPPFDERGLVCHRFSAFNFAKKR